MTARTSYRAVVLGAVLTATVARPIDPAAAAVEARSHGNPIAEAFPLIFDSERIELEIAGDSLEVRGTYHLLGRARAVEPIPLFYPFPRDSLLGGARMVSLVMRVGSGALEPARWEDFPGGSGVRWWLLPCAGDTLTIHSVYRQQIKSHYACYIVTTTQAWGRPLRHASFVIQLPRGADPIEFSFPFEPRDTPAGTVYVYDADDFFPDRDIVVRWKP